MAGKLGWSFLLAAALLTALLVGRYLTFDPEVYFEQQRDVYLAHRFALYAHILGGLFALLIGPFQFNAALRARWTHLHRWLGRMYVAGCFTGGSAGLYLAPFAFGGFPAAVGFGLLAVLWVACAALALQRVRAGNLAAHREWMIRSYALTLAAFTLRMWLGAHGVLSETGAIALPFEPMYVATAWLCWVPNLLAAEVFINQTRTPARPAVHDSTET
jgi:uncharacterized membrane protein